MFSPRSRDDSATPLDPVGAVLSLVGLTALLFGIIEGAERGWTDPVVVGAFVLAAVLAWAFVRWERVAAHPMLPLSYFSDRRFSVGSAVITTSFFVMFGWFFLFSLYLQFARGYSPLEAGLATLPFAAVFIVALAAQRRASPPASAADGRWPSGSASSASAWPCWPSSASTRRTRCSPSAMMLMAAGMSITAAPATDQDHGRRADVQGRGGSAVNDTTRELGGALGIAIFGTHRQLAVPHQPRPRRARARGDGQRRGDRSRSAARSMTARRSAATPGRR